MEIYLQSSDANTAIWTDLIIGILIFGGLGLLAWRDRHRRKMEKSITTSLEKEPLQKFSKN